jgi:hypothetical protein
LMIATCWVRVMCPAYHAKDEREIVLSRALRPV